MSAPYFLKRQLDFDQSCANMMLGHGQLLQQTYNGLNTFGTMKICSRQGKFELMSVDHSARSGGIIEISFQNSFT